MLLLLLQKIETGQLILTVFFCIGSNLGNRVENLLMARNGLAEMFRTWLTGCSSIYESEPLSLDDNGGWFLNQVLKAQTGLSPETLLENCLRLEDKIGRLRQKGKTVSRVIDIDILFYGLDIIHTPSLVVPHPRLHERQFVLTPLAEIAPALLHPILNKEIRQIQSELKNAGGLVRRYDPDNT